MNHIWSVLCKKSIIDIDTNNITLNEILEEVSFGVPLETALKFPANFNFEYELVSFWTSSIFKGGEKFYTEIELISPDKKVINKFEQEMAFPEGKTKLRTRIKANIITATKEGEYIFKVKAKAKKFEKFKVFAEIPLTIAIKRTMPATKKK
jgi:hypothetical protein